jgi:hypothetical protein
MQGTYAARSVGSVSYLNYSREVAVPEGADSYLSFWARDTSSADSWYGGLQVDVSVDGGVSWGTLWAQYDPQIAEDWSVYQVSLSAYKGRTIRLRLASKYCSDMAVDYIAIGEEIPAPPNLYSPANLTITDQQRPFLTVRNAVDPQGDQITGYRFEVYRDATLTNLVAQVPVVAEGTSYTSWQVDVNLPFEARYWWRARATDIKGNVSDWMTAAVFQVSVSNQPPAAPDIALPAQGDVLADLNELMIWYPAVDPNSGDSVEAYHLQIDDHADFSSPGVDVVDLASPIMSALSGGSPAAAIIMPLSALTGADGLPRGTNLYWRIRARDRFFAWSAWSTAEHFSLALRFADWRQGRFTAGELADPLVSGSNAAPRGDGIPNLLKYAFNLDPAVATTGAGRFLTEGTGAAGLPCMRIEQAGGLRLRIEFVRRRNAADLLYEPQFCTSLTAVEGTPNGWAVPTATETVTAIDADWERVVVEDQPPPGAASRFSRVRVTVP